MMVGGIGVKKIGDRVCKGRDFIMNTIYETVEFCCGVGY